MSTTPEPNRWGPFAALGEAIRFLTLIPTPGMPPMTEQGIGRAIPLFPAVGALIGALLLAAHALANWLWGGWVPAALAVVVWGAVTAGLHLDGLSDTFDAVLSWRPRERKLEIMKDSRIGAMGAIALVAVLLLKVAFLSQSGARWWQALLLAPVLGRWADCYGIVRFPPAAAGGLGKSFQAMIRPADFWVATGTALLLALLVGGGHGLVALLLAWLTAQTLGWWWTRDLGGLTGDTYGALCELCEVVVLAVFAVTIA